MVTINPYINFNGNTEEAFEFYQSVFGGEISSIVHFKDLAGPDFEVPADEANKIMRITLPIGGNLLIANDVPVAMGPVNENENRSKISVSVDSRVEADRIFAGLSAGGAIEMPMGDSPWGSYFGMFRIGLGLSGRLSLPANNAG